MARKPELAKEMESLKSGLKNLAIEAHRENYGRVLQRVDDSLSDIDALKNELSSFIAEIRSNREAIEDMRSDIASIESRIGGSAPEGGQHVSDSALITRDIETLKTRVKWLESKASLPNIDSLRARVEALENQLGGMKMSVPTVIE